MCLWQVALSHILVSWSCVFLSLPTEVFLCFSKFWGAQYFLGLFNINDLEIFMERQALHWELGLAWWTEQIPALRKSIVYTDNTRLTCAGFCSGRFLKEKAWYHFCLYFAGLLGSSNIYDYDNSLGTVNRYARDLNGHCFYNRAAGRKQKLLEDT